MRPVSLHTATPVEPARHAIVERLSVDALGWDRVHENGETVTSRPSVQRTRNGALVVMRDSLAVDLLSAS